MKLTLMTYNIAGGRDYRLEKPRVNTDAVTEVIRSYAPDIVGLNEVDYRLPRSGSIEMAKTIGDALGYESRFSPAVTWAPGKYGNGFISRHPILFHETVPIPDPGDDEPVYHETRCVLHDVVSLGGTETDVYVTHFGLAKAEQRNAAETLVSEIKKSVRPVILMGDFNILPDNALLTPVFAMLSDTFEMCGDRDTFSWPSDARFANEGEKPRKIDYIFVSKHFKVTRTEIPDIIASDHRPYITYAELADR